MRITPNGYHILRIGMGITFLWIGVLIWKDPMGWGGFLQPWALKLLIMPVKQVMMITAVSDIILGILLLANAWTFLASFIASVHLLIILITSGINEVTIRDIGLLGGTIALAMSAWPGHIKDVFCSITSHNIHCATPNKDK